MQVVVQVCNCIAWFVCSRSSVYILLPTLSSVHGLWAAPPGSHFPWRCGKPLSCKIWGTWWYLPVCASLCSARRTSHNTEMKEKISSGWLKLKKSHICNQVVLTSSILEHISTVKYFSATDILCLVRLTQCQNFNLQKDNSWHLFWYNGKKEIKGPKHTNAHSVSTEKLHWTHSNTYIMMLISVQQSSRLHFYTGCTCAPLYLGAPVHI